MSTTPKYNYQSEANKILVSLNLNIPLQFEIELETTESQKLNQLNQPNNQESLISAIHKHSDVVLKQINQAKLDEQIDEQIKNVLCNSKNDSFNNHQEEKPTTIVTQNISNTLFSNANELQSNLQNVNIASKRKVRLADSLNNSLTLTINFVGMMLRLGKLANYSWE